MQIRPYEEADWSALWSLLEPVFRAGETFPHDPAILSPLCPLGYPQEGWGRFAGAAPGPKACHSGPCSRLGSATGLPFLQKFS